jgi:hypothetical protein
VMPSHPVRRRLLNLSLKVRHVPMSCPTRYEASHPIRVP